MRFRLSQDWRLGAVLCPEGTVIDASADDYWSKAAKGKTIPFNSTPLDVEAYEAQLKAYPDAKHLLSGGWEEK
jgi:hypothetical protein